MKKLSKAIIIYSIIIVIGFTANIVYHSELEITLPTGEYVIGFNIVKETEVNKERIFDVMADIENYPNVLPENVISVNVINQTTSPGGAIVFFVEEKLVERGVVITQIVKHGIVQYDQHTITVMDGDGEGTKIVLKFKDEDDKTKITAEVKIRIKGILAPFGFLARSNIESAINTTIDNFIEYSKTN